MPCDLTVPASGCEWLNHLGNPRPPVYVCERERARERARERERERASERASERERARERERERERARESERERERAREREYLRHDLIKIFANNCLSIQHRPSCTNISFTDFSHVSLLFIGGKKVLDRPPATAYTHRRNACPSLRTRRRNPPPPYYPLYHRSRDMIARPLRTRGSHPT
jgi:hypothetical protein